MTTEKEVKVKVRCYDPDNKVLHEDRSECDFCTNLEVAMFVWHVNKYVEGESPDVS